MRATVAAHYKTSEIERMVESCDWIRFFWFWERRAVFVPHADQRFEDIVLGEWHWEYR